MGPPVTKWETEVTYPHFLSWENFRVYCVGLCRLCPAWFQSVILFVLDANRNLWNCLWGSPSAWPALVVLTSPFLVLKRLCPRLDVSCAASVCSSVLLLGWEGVFSNSILWSESWYWSFSKAISLKLSYGTCHLMPHQSYILSFTKKQTPWFLLLL